MTYYEFTNPAPEHSTLGSQAFIRGGGKGQSLKLSDKAAVFKRVCFLVEGAKHVD